MLHITQRYAAYAHSRVPAAHNDTLCAGSARRRGRDTTAAAAAGSTPPPRSGGGAGGGVALATVRRCHCTAAVAAHIERSQRCQLQPAGAAGGTGDNFCATGGGRLASAGARSSGRTPRERRNKFWPIRQQRGGRCAGGVPGQPAPTAGLSEHRRGSHAGGAGWGGFRFRACAVLGKKWIKRG